MDIDFEVSSLHSLPHQNSQTQKLMVQLDGCQETQRTHVECGTDDP